VRSAARQKIQDIDDKIRSLAAMKRALTQLEATCVREGSDRRCPLLESLGDEARGARR
jgi:hypothetical protein